MFGILMNDGPWGQPKKPENTGPKPSEEKGFWENYKNKSGGGRNSGGGNFDGFNFNFQNKFGSFINENGPTPKGIALIIGVIIAIWLVGGFFKVDPDEQAVIQRFGQFNRLAEPGLNYHLPRPIEAVRVEKVKRVNRIEIGFRSNSRSKGEGNSIQEESLMLTGDENILDINFEIQWRITDIKNFVFNVRDQEETIKNAAESAMREITGKTPIASALAEGRLKIEQETQDLLQNTLNNYGLGVEVVAVKMLKADPPSAVIDAFRDVQAARADRERLQNEAESYRNDIIPRARGMAEKIVQDAEGYKKDVSTRASGDASRFISVYENYKNAKEVTKKRMYLETMEHVMRGTNKIILDSAASKSGVVPYLPINELNKKKQPEPAQ